MVAGLDVLGAEPATGLTGSWREQTPGCTKTSHRGRSQPRVTSMERGGLVYVCDDTEQIRRLIRVNLELEGYEVREARDGEELIAALHELETLPGVVTIDAQMTPRDGWWTIAQIRSDPRLAHIAVIMVT